MSPKPDVASTQWAENYSEYAAWLQRGSACRANAFTVQAGTGVPEFAVQECREGLRRLCADEGAGADNPPLCLRLNMALPPEGYRLKSDTGRCVTLEGADANGLLYGIYAFLLRLAAGANLEQLDEASAPAARHR